MPNYEDMMTKSMGVGSGGNGGASSAASFSNFTSVNQMLKVRVMMDEEAIVSPKVTLPGNHLKGFHGASKGAAAGGKGQG